VERRLATVLFVDLVGSTQLVATRDPEVVRRRVTHFFDEAAAAVRAHGGIVEKFAGDAVMAAFGIPATHEDDAERAVRCALAIREAVVELGLDVRVGIESGEVVTEEGDSTFATGEAVNVAARLQASAAPQEIVMGPLAHRLVDGAVEVEPRPPLDVRGLGRELATWRVLDVPDVPVRRSRTTAPFIGREGELDLLQTTWNRVARSRRAHLVTIFGEPGIGKSRLAHELLASLEGATILIGRCLPYGEGITYWSLAEMVKAAAGIDDDDPAGEAIEKLRACCADDAVADLLGLAAGVLEAVARERSAQEIAWATRQWARELSDAQPLVLMFEDIHWAEDVLLDLLEDVARQLRDVPLLILCLARPELLDHRPAWGGGSLRAAAIELEPLEPEEAEGLADALLIDGGLSVETRSELLAKTEGNPLFLEETVRMLLEDGGRAGGGRIPDTVQTLIAARIDRLPRRSRSALRYGAVMGRIFWAGALAELDPDLAQLEATVDDLVDRGFITRETRSTISGEPAFRFKHVLIRDVAYAGLSKGARAEAHRTFARWLELRAGSELLEIRAFHLGEAAEILLELDGTVEPELAAVAAAALERSGRLALARQANRPARRRLQQAVALEPTVERRYWAAAAALRIADLPSVSEEMELVRSSAHDQGDTLIEALALTALSRVAEARDGDFPRAGRLVEQALTLLGDDSSAERFEVLSQRARLEWCAGAVQDDVRTTTQALEVARAIGRVDLEAAATEDLASAALALGDIERATELAETAIDLAQASGNVTTAGWALYVRGRIHALGERDDEALAAFEEAHERFTHASVLWGLARVLNELGLLSLRRGDQRTAERHFRDAIRLLAPTEDRGTLCESQRGLAEVLVESGRLDEAEQFALVARSTVSPHDVTSVVTTGIMLGRVRAAQGRGEEAETLLRDAVDRAERTGLPALVARATDALDEVLGAQGRSDTARVS
jgi:class 3 adenylate cyclase/tetratricopeptide (TPR) repeat protein